MQIQRWTLVVVCAATAMLMLDIAVVNTALSRIAEDLQTGLGGLQWVVDAYTLALASTVLTAGALADRLGRRRVFTWGLAIFTLASLACGLAQDIHMLNAARAVQGIGGAIMFAVSLALLAHAFPGARERAGALAAYGAAIGGSFALGPLVGGLLTSGLDWQWIFLVNLPIGVLCLWITRRYVEESRDPHSRRIDWPGQITLTAGLFLLVLALLRGNEQGWTSTPIVLELIGAAIALAAFVAVEARVREPMLPLRFFRDRTFTGAQIAAFAISASFFAVFLYSTLYLQQILGLSAIEAGLAYMPGTLVMLVVSGMTAQLGAKVPARTMVGGGLALVAVGMVLFTLAGVSSSWTVILPGLFVALIGTGLFNPALSAVALGSVPVEQSGVAAGVNDTFRQAGIAVGVAALGALIPAEAALGGGDPQAYVDGLHDAMLAGAGLAAVGALAAGLLISKRFGTAAPAPADDQPRPAALRPALEAA
jgi:EmrB/QacA subfamily drug resistance transporter